MKNYITGATILSVALFVCSLALLQVFIFLALGTWLPLIVVRYVFAAFVVVSPLVFTVVWVKGNQEKAARLKRNPT